MGVPYSGFNLQSLLSVTGDPNYNINAVTFASFEVYLVVTAIYLVLSVAFSLLFSALGRAAFAYPLGR